LGGRSVLHSVEFIDPKNVKFTKVQGQSKKIARDGSLREGGDWGTLQYGKAAALGCGRI